MHNRSQVAGQESAASKSKIRQLQTLGRALALVLVFLLCSGATARLSAAEPGAPGIVSRIHREPVESRALLTIGYSRRLRALEIEFKRGGTYRYLEVPASVHRELRAADSKARFYNTNVRGRYRSVFVRPARRK